MTHPNPHSRRTACLVAAGISRGNPNLLCCFAMPVRHCSVEPDPRPDRSGRDGAFARLCRILGRGGRGWRRRRNLRPSVLARRAQNGCQCLQSLVEDHSSLFSARRADGDRHADCLPGTSTTPPLAPKLERERQTAWCPHPSGPRPPPRRLRSFSALHGCARPSRSCFCKARSATREKKRQRAH